MEDNFQGMGMRVVTGNRYLGSFISDQESEKECLVENLEGQLVRGVIWVGAPLLTDSSRWPEKSLHHDWDFIQHVTPHIKRAF